ncbi:MAG: formate dehydrogenase subunit gamma [Acidobacteria bacterium]|nr:formate dehydrogenase subunit gamma [Acidobacteriota bacterium]
MAHQMTDPNTLSQSQIAARAREQEDVVVNDLIIRHTAGARLTHWLLAIFFFLSALTGFVIYTPFFAGLAGIFGGGAMTRFLHPWFSLGFVISALFLCLAWFKRMKREFGDDEWRKNFGAYMRYETELHEVGKYNAGQKLFFWSVVWGAAAMLVSGIIMWFPTSFHWIFRMIAYWLHEVTFIAFVVGVIYHIYMSTAAMPGTLGAMTRGTVTKAWARWHHPRWYREVTGEEK